MGVAESLRRVLHLETTDEELKAPGRIPKGVREVGAQKRVKIAIVMPCAEALTGTGEILLKNLTARYGREHAEEITEFLSGIGWNHCKGGWLPYIKALNMIEVQSQFPHNDFICHYAYYQTSGPRIGFQRDKGVEDALAAGCDYLWFQDWDVINPVGAFGNLYMRNKDIVSGVVFMKNIPPRTMAMAGPLNTFYDEWWQDPVLAEDLRRQGLKPLSGLTVVPCGCLLVKADVFRNIDPPWFTDGSCIVPSGPSKGRASDWTDDSYFCNKAIQAGYKLHLDLTVQCDHFDMNSGMVWGFDVDHWRPAWRWLGHEDEWRPFALEAIDIGNPSGPEDTPEGQAGRAEPGPLAGHELEQVHQ